MLLKSKISEHSISLDPALNESYDKAKLGKFTSSEFHYLMAEKGIGSAGKNYIYRKVGEVMTGMKSRPDISTAATEHGLNYEREGLQKFGEMMIAEGKFKANTKMLVQRLIIDGEHCGGTPDGLIVLNESTDGLSLSVQSVECKCPLSFDGYIRLWKCKTPEDLKKESREYFYQCLHQAMICDCLVFYFICYHPFFSSGQLNVIEFRKVNLISEFKIIEQRKKEAIEIFEETINELKK